MRFYNQQHRFYCGTLLHARSMYLCILDHSGARILFCDPALGLCKSKGEFKRMLEQKALSVNDSPLAADTVRGSDLLPGGVLILRKGKKSYGVVEYA